MNIITLLDKMEKNDNTIFPPLIKIISGGQTGADQGALDAAKFLGIETGGTTTHGFITSNGKNPELGTKYNLKELDGNYMLLSTMYIKRSMLNVDNSDGTIAFRLYSSPGTDKTIGYCFTKTWKVCFNNKTTYRPILIIDNLLDKNITNKIKNFIIDNNIKILNICGHRDNNLQILVRDIIINTFTIK